MTGSWNSITERNGKLTKETFTSLHHTTYAFLELIAKKKWKCYTNYLENFKLITLQQSLVNTGNLVGLSISRCNECLSVKKIRMLSVLKLSLPFNQKYIKIDFKNLQEPNWDEVREERKLEVYKFRIDVKEDDINKCREVLLVILYLASYCCCVVFKKIKCNSCKVLITGRDNVEEIPEINSYFQWINRGSLFYPNDTTTNFVIYNYVVIDKLIKTSFFSSFSKSKEISREYNIECFGKLRASF